MKKLVFLALFAMGISTIATAQNPLQYYRAQDKTGINMFESPKETDVEFDGLRVKVGGANTLQFQALDHETASDQEIFNL